MDNAQRKKDLFAKTVAVQKAGTNAEAQDAYRAYLAHYPTDYQAWTNLGALLRSAGKYAVAIAAHTKSLEFMPNSDTARGNLINALLADGQFERAIAECAIILKVKPEHPEIFRLRLVALRSLGQHRQVAEELTAWEARFGIVEKNRIQRAMSLLTLGDYKAGFADFENRFTGGEVSLPENVKWPRWQGEPLAARRILVLPEQGMGDMIIMARFLPQLKALGGEVHVVARKPLLRLLEGIAGVDSLREGARQSEHFDFYTTIMSLPHLLGFTGEPPPPVAIKVPEDSRARARAIVAPYAKRFKIGIIWTGALTYAANHRRSVEPVDFATLAQVPGVQLFSLYKGDAHGDFLASGMPGLIVDACGKDRDLADAAAVIEQMDLLITTDTSVVHVAGALGKENWNLMSSEGFWLYGTQERTPWYPKMKLYRQGQGGGWGPVFRRLEADLAARLGVRLPPGLPAADPDFPITEAQRTLQAARQTYANMAATAKGLAAGRLRQQAWRAAQMQTGDRPRWFSQAGQDRFLDEQVFKGKRGGVFIDVGTFDGVTGSNTMFFELFRNWKGLLVEPSPNAAAEAMACRRAPLAQCAVGPDDGMAEFLNVTAGYTQMSGLAATYDAKTRAVIEADRRHAAETIKVPVKRLQSLIADFALTDIDYISLDVEGAELPILRDFDFARFKVNAWSIENNDGTGDIAAIMTRAGYQLVANIGVDEIYVRS